RWRASGATSLSPNSRMACRSILISSGSSYSIVVFLSRLVVSAVQAGRGIVVRVAARTARRIVVLIDENRLSERIIAGGYRRVNIMHFAVDAAARLPTWPAGARGVAAAARRRRA